MWPRLSSSMQHRLKRKTCLCLRSGGELTSGATRSAWPAWASPHHPSKVICLLIHMHHGSCTCLASHCSSVCCFVCSQTIHLLAHSQPPIPLDLSILCMSYTVPQRLADLPKQQLRHSLIHQPCGLYICRCSEGRCGAQCTCKQACQGGQGS